jgi:hypothetical protein
MPRDVGNMGGCAYMEAVYAWEIVVLLLDFAVNL